MKKSALAKVAMQSIVKNKMRTLLTMLGIVIGVGAVIIVVALANGAQTSIQQQINTLGTNIIMITPGASQAGGVNQGAGTFNRLTVQDAEKLERESTLLTGVSVVVNTMLQAIGGGNNWRTRVNGVSAQFASIRDWKVEQGAFFVDFDVRSMRKVAVLGKTVANSLYPGMDPVGMSVQLRDVPFTVIGVLAPKGQNAQGQDQDDIVIVPYTTAQARLGGGPGGGPGRVFQIVTTTANASDLAAAQAEIREIMRESHKLGEFDEDDFTIRNQNDIANAASGTTRVMSILLAAIASVSLVVGGIGIMNIMLVSVTERTREIGIRMAIGARASDVLTQFLVESIVMSLLGGVIGLGVGYGGAHVLGRITGFTMATPPEAVIIAVGFSAAVGVCFGYYPARKAAALDPIQALRHE